MEYNNDKFTRNSKGRVCHRDGLPIVGLLLIGFGVVFLLDRLGLLPYETRRIIISWPSLLIFIGVVNLFRNHSRFPAIILILVGTTFLIPRIIDVPFETRQLIWPVLLIAVGIIIVFIPRRVKHPHYFDTKNITVDGVERIDEIAIMGGGKRVIQSRNIKGGNVTAIFGGLEIDLTEADFVNDITVIEVSAIFGGVSLFVKPEWDVQIQVTSILGGFSDERKIYKNNNTTKTLIIKGAAIFGGGEVKSI